MPALEALNRFFTVLLVLGVLLVPMGVAGMILLPRNHGALAAFATGVGAMMVAAALGARRRFRIITRAQRGDARDRRSSRAVETSAASSAVARFRRLYVWMAAMGVLLLALGGLSAALPTGSITPGAPIFLAGIVALAGAAAGLHHVRNSNASRDR